MAGPSNNASFIPKRGTNKKTRKTRSNSLYLLTIISYTLVLTSLLASLGVFFYGRHVQSQLQNEIISLNNEVSDFKEADMQRVLEFDVRLQQASQRLQNSVSIVSIFNALEAATIDTVRFSDLTLERDGDIGFDVVANIETDTFDSSIFQRGVLERNEVIDDIAFENVLINDGSSDDGQVRQSVSFTALLSVPLDAVPYTTTVSTPPVSPVVIPEEEVTTEEVIEVEESNPDSL